MKIQSINSLKNEMQAVARGDIKTTTDVAQPSFESVEAATSLLASEKYSTLVAAGNSKFESILSLAGVLYKKGRKPLPIEELSR